MAINIPVPVRPYARSTNDEGVPLAALSSIIGTLVERYRHMETVSTASSGTTCIQIGYKPLTNAANYRVFITSSAGAVKLDGSIEGLTWQGLQHASVGATLVQNAQPTQTGHTLTNPDIAISPAVLVGRTDTNFILFQGVSLAVGDIIEIFSTEFTGGEITERLLRQTSGAPHRVRLKGLFATVPTTPPTLGYDGSYATGITGTNWVELDEQFPNNDLVGGTVYNLFADATYNPLAARWLLSNIYIFSPEGGVNVQYSTTDSGPWHEAQAADDRWRRWRDSLLLWHVEPLNELDDGWQYLANFVWDGGSDPDPGVYTEWTKALTIPVEFSEWKFLHMELEWSSTSGSEFIIVPCNILKSGPVGTSGFSEGVGRVMHFRRNNQGASYDDSKYDATRRSTGSILGFRYQFLHSTDEGSHQASQIRIHITGSAVIATLRFFVGR